jgi:APA family basic amino acid/polyamine antiporter
VLVVRKTMPGIRRGFSCPFVPVVPILGILTCVAMMCFLPADTWIRLVLWMLIGLDIYATYGIKHSKLEPGKDVRKGDSTLNILGISLAALSIITGLWHQQTAGWDADKTLLVISIVFAIVHFIFYITRMVRNTKK